MTIDTELPPLPSQSFTRWQIRLIVGLCLVAIGARFVALDRSFWLDEVVTVLNIDVNDWKTVLVETSHDNQPPLYNMTAFAWAKLFGYSEIAVRSLSLLYGIAALFTPWLARSSLTPDEKLVNFAILCLMSFPIRYAQEARNYSLLLLLSAICLYSFYELNAASRSAASRAARGTGAPAPGDSASGGSAPGAWAAGDRAAGSAGAVRAWVLYLGLTLLAFTHIFGIMLALCFIAVMFVRARSNLGRAGLCVFAVLLTAATLGPLLLGGSAQQAGGNFWIHFGARVVGVEVLKLFTPVGIALLTYGLVRWRASSVKIPFDAAMAWSLLPFLLLLAGALAVSLHTPIFMAHYLIGLIPAFALLVSWLLRPVSGIGPKTVMIALALLLIQALALTFSPYLFVQEDLREIARTSVALDSRVCYVVPDGSAEILGAKWSYYVTQRFGRPDLKPILVTQSELPQAFPNRQCGLWAEAHLAKRGVTVLHDVPAFAACRDLPLGPPGAVMASALVDCRH